MLNKELEDAYMRYYQPLFLYALSLTKNKADAEDLVANTFIKALLSYEKGNLKAWLYVVLKNEFYNLYKKRKRIINEGVITLEWIEDSQDILMDYIYEDQKRWLYEHLYQMSTLEQEVMLLSLQNDLKDEFISMMLKISIENVRVIRFRVKKKLIELSKEEGYL
ncbi:MAG: RNA polymerase sigma factor [Coprobacillus sp.]